MPAGQRVTRWAALAGALSPAFVMAPPRPAALAGARALARAAALAAAIGAWQSPAHALSRVTITAPDPQEPRTYQPPLRQISLDPKQAAQFSEQLFELINHYRTEAGLPPLQWANELRALATAHSLKMARRDAINHDGFAQRFTVATSQLCVENVGARFRDPESQLGGWRASPVHRRNLLDPDIRRVGIANARGYVTYFACR